jgi:hypothetical protein
MLPRFSLVLKQFPSIKYFPSVLGREQNVIILGSHIIGHSMQKKKKLHGLSPQRTIPTERPPLVGELIAKFCG